MSETAGDKSEGACVGRREVALSAWLYREIAVIIFDRRCRKYYHAALMSGPAAAHVLDDPFGFARAAGQLQGQLAVSALPRLQDQLAGNAGEVRYSVHGGLDPLDRPQLELEVTGTVELLCAHCVKPLSHPLALRTRVLMAQPGTVPLDDEDPESPEWIEAGQELDLQELVEDEILLGLPLSVRHAQGHCSSESQDAYGKKAADSPFARLASLLEPGQTNKR